MTEVSRRNAVVTGAAGGMGRAITRALIESGRKVVLVDRDAESLRALASEMGDNTFAVQLDITDAENVDRLLELIPDAFKPVDILVNNAGHDIGGRTRFDVGAADDWSNIIVTRYRGDRQKEKEYFDQFKMALEPADVARSIVFAIDQPAHVQIAEMMILPVNRY